MTGRVEAVVFWDLDGTLLTTARAGVFALEEALREVRGVDADLSSLVTSGLTDAEVASLALRTARQPDDPATVDAFLRAYERHLPASLHRRRGAALSGVVEILTELRDRPDVASLLLTGNTAAGATAKLAHYALDAFFPHPGAFCEAPGPRVDIARKAAGLARKLLADDSEGRVYVVGDTPYDIRCGNAIGARTVAVATGSHTAAELAEHAPWLLLERLPPPDEFFAALGLGQRPG